MCPLKADYAYNQTVIAVKDKNNLKIFEIRCHLIN